MARVLVGGLTRGIRAHPDTLSEDPTALVARRLRDGGHEVLFVGSGVSPTGLAAAAVQEDVDAVALAEGGEDHPAGELAELLASYGAGDIVVFAADQFVSAQSPRGTGAAAQD